MIGFGEMFCAVVGLAGVFCGLVGFDSTVAGEPLENRVDLMAEKNPETNP
jgi:hypothetical protein